MRMAREREPAEGASWDRLDPLRAGIKDLLGLSSDLLTALLTAQLRPS